MRFFVFVDFGGRSRPFLLFVSLVLVTFVEDRALLDAALAVLGNELLDEFAEPQSLQRRGGLAFVRAVGFVLEGL